MSNSPRLYSLLEKASYASDSESKGWYVSGSHGLCVRNHHTMIADLDPSSTPKGSWTGKLADAEFIAAANPLVVTRLVQTIRVLEGALNEALDHIEYCVCPVGVCPAERLRELRMLAKPRP